MADDDNKGKPIQKEDIKPPVKTGKKGPKNFVGTREHVKYKRGPCKKRECNPSITAEQYNTMWACWNEQQSLPYAAKKAGVSTKIAIKYIKGPGAPQYGMEPIEARYLRVQKAAHQEEDMSLIKWRKTVFDDYVRKNIQILKGEQALHQKMIARQLDRLREGKPTLPTMKMKDLVDSLDKLFRMGEHALGGPDQITGHMSAERFENWTEEELLSYWECGIRPEHDM